jgi:hypothetical protein
MTFLASVLSISLKSSVKVLYFISISIQIFVVIEIRILRFQLASERINSTTSSIVKLAFPIEKNQGENTFVAVIVQSDYNGRLYINLTGPNNFSRTLITAEKTATVRIPDIAQVNNSCIFLFYILSGGRPHNNRLTFVLFFKIKKYTYINIGIDIYNIVLFRY